MTKTTQSFAGLAFIIIALTLLTAPPILQSKQSTLSIDLIHTLPGEYGDIVRKDDYLFTVGRFDDLLYVFDISNPAYPDFVRTLDGSYGYRLVVEDNHLYTFGNGLQIIDISDPPNLYVAGNYNDFESYMGYFPWVSYIGARDNAVYVSYNYSERGCTLYGKMATIDVSDPTTPIRTNIQERSSGMFNIVTYQDYAYVLSGSQALIFDINDPLYPQQGGLPINFDDVLAGYLIVGEDRLFASFANVSTICEDSVAWFYVADISEPSNARRTTTILSYPDETPFIWQYQDGYLYSGQRIGLSIYFEVVSEPDFITPLLLEELDHNGLVVHNGFLYFSDSNSATSLTSARLYSAKVQVEPTEVQTLVYTDGVGQETTVEIGVGAVMSRTEVSYLPLPTVDSPLPDLWVGQAFDLAGYMPDDQQTLMAFQEPVTVTLPYTTSELVAGWQFMFWDDTKWVPAEDTCLMVNGEWLMVNDERLAANGQLLTANSQPPTANRQPPTANGQLQFSLCSPGKYALFIVPYETFFPIAQHK